VPRVEITRAQGRLAAVNQSLEQARLSVLSARFALVDAMGVNAGDPANAPVASDSFTTELPDLPPLKTLLQIAASERHDPLALQALADASGALAAAATNDLKRSVNFSITAGLSTMYESPFFRFLPDEQDPIQSDFQTKPTHDTPIRYFSATGFWRSLRGQWLPFTSANITFELPFGNHRALGRARQAQAASQRSLITFHDLNRVIADNVTNASGLVRSLANAIKEHQTAVTFQQQTLDSTLERLKIGDLTVLDTILTEEDLTQDRLRLIRDQQLYLSALARLKFETGTLLEFRDANTPAESAVFSPLERFGH
jgi:outer membrane protein TolC